MTFFPGYVRHKKRARGMDYDSMHELIKRASDAGRGLASELRRIRELLVQERDTIYNPEGPLTTADSDLQKTTALAEPIDELLDKLERLIDLYSVDFRNRAAGPLEPDLKETIAETDMVRTVLASLALLREDGPEKALIDSALAAITAFRQDCHKNLRFKTREYILATLSSPAGMTQ